jgi:hypothetical protein
MLLTLIAVLTFLSFYNGLKAIHKGFYKPNIYSRIIWSLLAANAFIGLVRLENYSGIIVLSGLQVLGGLLVLAASFRYSIFEFGITEKLASLLLVGSCIVWIVADLPALNVAISLLAHFIGGIPTMIRVLKKPTSEYTAFWVYFAIGSFIAFVFSDKSDYRNYMFALYFAFYNSSIIYLSLRKNFSFKRIWT